MKLKYWHTYYYVLSLDLRGNVVFLTQNRDWRNIRHMGRIKPLYFEKVPKQYLNNPQYEVKSWKKTRN